MLLVFQKDQMIRHMSSTKEFNLADWQVILFHISQYETKLSNKKRKSYYKRLQEKIQEKINAINS